MDSLTQIVLGAAVGEAAAGRKIGNRAMLWGAVAGTIPDLDDMIGSLFMNEINGLAFHRAITHSIFFAVVFSFLIAYYTNWLYSNGYHKNKVYRIVAMGFTVLFLALVCGVFGLIFYTLFSWIGLCVSALLSVAALSYFVKRMKNNYLDEDQETINIGYWSWYNLFFWAIFTHPILDSFTTYGTQLFAPFSNYRVAFNNISVADPVYTVPFLICVISAGLMARRYHLESNNHIDQKFRLSSESYKWRQRINILGIVLSTSYIGWTFYNKMKVNKVMEHTLESMNIDYSRYMTSPTILNNILWSGTAETEQSFYTGLYSFYDRDQTFKLFEVPKNHDWLEAKADDNVVETLKWFSNDYYSVLRRKDGRLQINDMRFGTFRGKQDGEDSYIFRFIVEKDEQDNYVLNAADGGPKRGGEEELFQSLINRIKGE